jgi:hypothetical protein
LREHSPADADFTLTEIGIASYYADRRVVDLMGLVTPRAVAHVAAHDVRRTLIEAPTEYVLVHHHRPRMLRLAATPWFQAAYEEVAEHPDLQGDGRLVIYRRRTAAALAAPGED